MALGDIYEVKFNQLFVGQAMINVYHYYVLNEVVPSSAIDLVNNLANLTSAQNDIQDVAVTNVGLQAKNIGVLADFAETAVLGGGTQTGDYEATFLAWKFKLLRSDRSVHNGSKAIGGVASSGVTNGAANSGILAALTAYATAYAANVVSTDTGNTYAQVIYRLPDDGHPIGQGFFNTGAQYVKLSPQKTRQIGRGI